MKGRVYCLSSRGGGGSSHEEERGRRRGVVFTKRKRGEGKHGCRILEETGPSHLLDMFARE